MRQKIFSVLIVLYLLVAFADYLDREGLKKGLWDDILWRDGGLPVFSLAKGLLWPMRFITSEDKAEKVRPNRSGSHQYTAPDPDSDLIGQVCLQGFARTSVPHNELIRFCKCVQDDIGPQLTNQQRLRIREARAIMARGQLAPDDFFVASGLPDLIRASQARCQAALYPPIPPSN